MPTATLVTALPPSRAPGAVPTGPVGRHLARRLLAAGGRVRVLAPAAELTGWPAGAELIEGTVADPAASPAAFRDLGGVCVAGLVSMVPENLRDLANLALRGGARRAVVLSSHGSDFEDEYSPETWQWLAFEQALAKRGAEWTYVRPTALFANALAGGYPVGGWRWADLVRRGATIREFRPDVPYPYLHEEDLAGVLAAVLLDGGHHRRVLDVSGAAISARERMRMLGDALGRPLPFAELASPAAARAYWRQEGWPEATIEVTLWAMSRFAADAATIMPLVRQQEELTRSLLGRPPLTFADWLASHLPAFR